MAGQARREHRGRGRSSRVGSEWPVIAAVSGVASGSATAITTAPASPASTAELPTRATYRNLLSRGLAPDEAANLTAFLAGIPIGESSWTLRQVNQLLFLRQMNRAGAFIEPADLRPH
ncbi:MAG TPA: hypothetical protein VFK35_06105 [Candidatus Limnocylindrales bacterium]|nr:hypothetical protein [Candidatus Limnocylindrales bacterium]